MNKAIEEQRLLHGNFIRNCYVLNIQGEVDDEYLRILYNDIIYVTGKFHLSGIILDFNNIFMADSFIFEFLKNISKTVSLMGIKVVWVGLKPGVVSALIDFNDKVDDICTAVNLQFGLECIN